MIDAERQPARRGQLLRARRAVLVGRAESKARSEGVIRRSSHRSTSAAARAVLRKALRYVFPDHWSFLLGEVALYSFVVLVGTGDLPDALLRAEPAKTTTTALRAAARRWR
jgi:hypothetical protein